MTDLPDSARNWSAGVKPEVLATININPALVDEMRFRVKFYEGERCWGVEHNAPLEHVTSLLAQWSTVCKADEYVVIEQGNER